MRKIVRPKSYAGGIALGRPEWPAAAGDLIEINALSAGGIDAANAFPLS
jgi:hypothetical protein